MLIKTAIYTLSLLFGIGTAIAYIPSVYIPIYEHGKTAAEYMAPTMLFVGDIMLGRNVELLAQTKGDSYPFIQTKSIIESSNIAIGNFEGAVPKVHVPTKNFSFKFSVDKSYLGELVNTGFDILSLANNHSLDYGEEGYLYTKESCEEYRLDCIGHPITLGSISVIEKCIDGVDVGIIFLHTLYKEPDNEVLAKILDDISSRTSIQIIYVHWGNEYEHKHNASQELLAHYLINRGADAVIGHHPHVVQDIELYKEKPIFYSLGNFVFDQYFSDDVQQGLGVRLTIGNTLIRYELIPFTSILSHSQPSIMSTNERDAFVSRIVDSTVISTENSEYPYFTTSRD